MIRVPLFPPGVFEPGNTIAPQDAIDELADIVCELMIDHHIIPKVEGKVDRLFAMINNKWISAENGNPRSNIVLRFSKLLEVQSKAELAENSTEFKDALDDLADACIKHACNLQIARN